jgi:hypothetical protein
MKAPTGILACVLATAAACSGSDENRPSATRDTDLGTGLNTVDRQYGKPASDVWDAAVSAVKSYDFSIESDRNDKMGGELVARRASGEKVTVRVKSVKETSSDVSVRVEPGNRNLANLLHERIAEKLGMGPARTGFLGGNSADGTYADSLKRCIAASETAFRACGLELTQRDVKETSAVLDARRGQDGLPARIELKRGGDATKASFIAGTGRSADSQALADRLKAEFERHLASAQGN